MLVFISIDIVGICEHQISQPLLVIADFHGSSIFLNQYFFVCLTSTSVKFFFISITAIEAWTLQGCCTHWGFLCDNDSSVVGRICSTMCMCKGVGVFMAAT